MVRCARCHRVITDPAAIEAGYGAKCYAKEFGKKLKSPARLRKGKTATYAPAVLLGIAIANATSPFGPVDVAFGLVAEGAAYLLVVWGPWKKLGILWKAVILSLSVALFIGVELYAMVGAPFLLTAAGLFVGTFLAVELGNMMISKTVLARIV